MKTKIQAPENGELPPLPEPMATATTYSVVAPGEGTPFHPGGTLKPAGSKAVGYTAEQMRAYARAALAAPAPQATDAELERRTGEPHVDGWPLVSGLPSPAEAHGDTGLADTLRGIADEHSIELTDEARRALDRAAELIATKHQPDAVPMPTNADQAAAMALIGERWLRDNAPERLRESQPKPKGAALTDEQADAIADAHRWDTREGRRAIVRAALANQAPAPVAEVENLRRDYARALDTIKGHAAQIGKLEQHIRELRAFQAMVNRYAPEFPVDPDAPRDVWYWQGDGRDHLESMVHQLPVVIRAEQLRELLAATQAPAVGADWQPIKTAPKDRSIVLANATQVSQGQWAGRYFAWGYSANPTHWMPLPAAPGFDVPVQGSQP